MNPVYLDHNATTPLDGRVLEAMSPYQRGLCANPSSPHRLGRLAREAVERARAQVAALVGAAPGEVVFTSGGTEANNLAIHGAAMLAPHGRIAVSAVEHESVLRPAEHLVREGWSLERIPVDGDGRVTAAVVSGALKRGAGLVSVMLANNETGVLQDLSAIGERVRECGALLHCDAVQAAGKLPVKMRSLGVDLLTLSAHKLYGPQGVGALIVRDGLAIEPLLYGGGQEAGRRSGTENVAGIVGFGVAAELAATELEARSAALGVLRDYLEQRLGELAQVSIVAARAERLPNTVLFMVRGVEGGTLRMQLDRLGIAVSSGSACDSGKDRPSHVLEAMGVEPALIGNAVRVSLGRDNTRADVDALIEALQAQLGSLAAVAASWA